MQDSAQATEPQPNNGPVAVATAEQVGDGIKVSPNDVIANMQQLYAEMFGDLTHKVCLLDAALMKSQDQVKDLADRLATANARLARRAN